MRLVNLVVAKETIFSSNLRDASLLSCTMRLGSDVELSTSILSELTKTGSECVLRLEDDAEYCSSMSDSSESSKSLEGTRVHSKSMSENCSELLLLAVASRLGLLPVVVAIANVADEEETAACKVSLSTALTSCLASLWHATSKLPAARLACIEEDEMIGDTAPDRNSCMLLLSRVAVAMMRNGSDGCSFSTRR